MSVEQIVLACFNAALKANGENMAGSFERELLYNYLILFPEFKAELKSAALGWISEDNDIAIHRINDVVKNVFENG